jgi:hypothetical protein
MKPFSSVTGREFLTAPVTDTLGSKGAHLSLRPSSVTGDSSGWARILPTSEGESTNSRSPPVNGDVVLNAATIVNDGIADRSWGGAGLDWFITGPGDGLLDRVSKRARELASLGHVLTQRRALEQQWRASGRPSIATFCVADAVQIRWQSPQLQKRA